MHLQDHQHVKSWSEARQCLGVLMLLGIILLSLENVSLLFSTSHLQQDLVVQQSELQN
jgi:hypothetical protein